VERFEQNANRFKGGAPVSLSCSPTVTVIGVVLDDDDNLIGMSDYGGNGSTAGFFKIAGTVLPLREYLPALTTEP
jgi:hypothetical protein